jgi:hypothetical protein
MLTWVQKALESLAKDGFLVKCADGHNRQCYPIIAGFMADYEEQVLITGIKKAQHCSICTVPPHERENLTEQWDDRTHELTQQQISHQRQTGLLKTDDTWVHDVENFAWKHPYLNIHKAMMIDVLHQLLKGITMYLITWVKTLASSVLPAVRKRKRQSRTIKESSGSVQLDERFRCVPPFTGLKRFACFSKVKQWTGVEQRAMIRQLIPVIAPLLSTKVPGAMHCARAIIDFILLAQYKTHNDETLRYLDHALYRIDKTKVVFKQFRPVDKVTAEGHFNFPKFHAMTHYTSFIREYGAADNFDTEHSEAAHKYHVKAFYGRTNKRRDYENQICLHNTRRINMLAMANILFHKKSRHTTQSGNSIEAQVSVPTRMQNLTQLGWEISHTNRNNAHLHGLDTDFWRTAGELAIQLGIEGFIDALAVFVRESRKRLDKVPTMNTSTLRRESDPSWVEGLPVALHPSIRCWRRKGNDSKDLELLTKEYVRCKQSWQSGKDWRRDYVWVQDTEMGNGSPLDGRKVGQVQAIITIIDNLQHDSKDAPVQYTGVLVELLRFRDNGRVHDVHGMVEVEDWPQVRSQNSRKIGHRYFFDMSTILRSAHIIPTGTTGLYYVNNYIDWDHYNTIFDPEFLVNGIRDADRIAMEYR